MAVTINQMDVEVQSGKRSQQASGPNPAQSGTPQEPMNIRQEMEKLAERQRRLRAE
jgi:hypothetical protein